MEYFKMQEESIDKNIWVYIETELGYTQPVSFELLQIGKILTQTKHCLLIAIILGHHLTPIIKDVLSYGADQVIVLDDPIYAYYSTDGYSKTMISLIKKYKPEAVLIGATDNGRDLAPRIACNLETGLIADCTGIEIDKTSGCIAWTRPAFSGNLMATILCPTARPQIGTVRPGIFHDFREKKDLLNKCFDKNTIIYEDPVVTEDQIRTRILEQVDVISDFVDLESSEIIVAGGKGIGSEQGFQDLKEFATAIGGVTACSRSAAEAGWFSSYYQVGQSGKTVHPRIYFAIGISGAIQHLAGITNAHNVIAINTDPEANIFHRADYGIVGDYKEILPLLEKRILLSSSQKTK